MTKTQLVRLSTTALYALIEEAGEGEEWNDLVDEAFNELDRRELAEIEEWYAPAS